MLPSNNDPSDLNEAIMMTEASRATPLRQHMAPMAACERPPSVGSGAVHLRLASSKGHQSRTNDKIIDIL